MGSLGRSDVLGESVGRWSIDEPVPTTVSNHDGVGVAPTWSSWTSRQTPDGGCVSAWFLRTLFSISSAMRIRSSIVGMAGRSTLASGRGVVAVGDIGEDATLRVLSRAS
jgi:hypothetical protein